jgi:hypothetical protein
MIINNHGDPQSPIWLIYDEPFSTDVDRGYILSGGLGFMHRKVWSLSGLPEPYIYVMKPCIGASYDYNVAFSKLVHELSLTRVPFVLPTSTDLFQKFCPDLVTKSQGKALFKKYTGNLLSCNYLNWPHYIIPQYPADFVGANWDYHEIQAYIDLGHVKEEWEYWSANGATLKPLPIRQLITEPTYEDILSFLYRCRYEFSSGAISYISVDIETIRPQKGSYYHKIHHPGYPYTISIALNPSYGISFSLWDYAPNHLVKIWRELDAILADIPQIGQNYLAFDAHWLSALGFRIKCLEKCQDTLIRHHILWPGLEHKLQFQTKQYTRQPFYKDEGKQWTPKYKRALMHYNALDSTVTYEIYNAQELEFNERPHLR